MVKKRWLGLAFSALFILGGCAGIRPPVTSTPVRGQHLAKRQPPPLAARFHAVGRWELKGAKQVSGYFDWHHDAEHDTLILLSSWSLPLAELRREGREISISTSQGQHLTESQWMRASEQMLGVPLVLPLQPMSSWIQGHFEPSMKPGRVLNANPEMPSLVITGEQEGWQLRWIHQQGDRVAAEMSGEFSGQPFSTANLYPQRVEIHAPDVQYQLVLIVNQESSSWK